MPNLRTQKTRGLLAYLILLEGRPVSRTMLAALLWPEQTTTRANHNLRQSLSFIRRAFHFDNSPPLLYISRQDVQFNRDAAMVDVYQFVQAVHSSRSTSLPADDQIALLSAAIDNYKGELLAGFYLDGVPTFESWLMTERERWHLMAVATLERIATHQFEKRVFRPAIDTLQRLIHLEPWHESAYRQLMRIYAALGDRASVKTTFERCRQALTDELDIEPTIETVALYESLSRETSRTQINDLRRHNLPAATLPFVGRAIPLAHVVDRLQDPSCRLLTIMGPGGVGKTRLAIHAARQMITAFADGIILVPLAEIAASEMIVPTIARELSLAFYSRAAPETQLIDYLRHKQTLLILDNVEQLIDISRDFFIELLPTLLREAPKVKVLVTSRQRLGLRTEWLLPLSGMEFPDPSADDLGLPDFEALQLFARAAQRVSPYFKPNRQDYMAIADICRILEGLPLGIELAAGWVQHTSCVEIIAEMRSSLDVIASDEADIPERHRSLRAVFNHSWSLLNISEQQILQKLAYFPASFSRSAAAVVTGISLSQLATFVNKSFLRRIRSGGAAGDRYEMHSLIREYAYERLQQFALDYRETASKQATFVATLLEEQQFALNSLRQKESLDLIDSEMANVRTAWQWMVANRAQPLIEQALPAMFRFYTIRSWYDEGRRVLADAEAVLVGDLLSSAAAQAAAWHGQLCFNQGRYGEAVEHFNRGLQLAQTHSWVKEEALSRYNLGALYTFENKLDQAADHLAHCLALYETVGELTGIASAYHALGNLAMRRRSFDEAADAFQRAISFNREAGNLYGTAQTLNALGYIRQEEGALITAHDLYRESLAIREEIGDQRGMAIVLLNMGRVAHANGQLPQAEAMMNRSLGLFRQIGERQGIANILTNLGEVAIARESIDLAITLFEESLGIKRTIGDYWGEVYTAGRLGSALILFGKEDQGRETLVQALEMARQREMSGLQQDILARLDALN